MKMVLRPLTPIWTGNNDGYSTELRATGLLGSLRWWFEGLVRGLGYYACDPTEGGCLYRKDGDPICAACRLFGTTGWARRFRFRASGLAPKPWYVLANPAVARAHENWLTRVYKPNSQVLWGERLELEFLEYLVEREPEEVKWGETELCLAKLIEIVAWLGAVGGKSQNGFGGVEFLECEARSAGPKPGALREVLKRWSDLGAPDAQGKHDDWFDLRQTRFLHFVISDPGIYARGAEVIPRGGQRAYEPFVLPIAYDIRYRSKGDRFSKEHELVGLRPALKVFLRDCGASGTDVEDLIGSSARSPARTASRVFVQHLFRKRPQDPYTLKIWIHVPKRLPVDPGQVGEAAAGEIRRMFPGAQYQHFGWEEVARSI